MSLLDATWRHVRRSPYQAIAAVLITTLTFFVVSIFTFLIVGTAKIIAYFESKPQVTAFFKDEARQEHIDELRANLKATGKVASMQFVSKQEALKIYREQNKDDPLLLDLVTAEILPASLEISAVKLSDLAGISETLKGSPHVQDVIFQKDVVSTLTSWTDALRKIGIGFIIALSVVSVAIMATSVGMKISQKREEIEVMRLLGATSWYIRWPFILEGMLYGSFGALLGWGVATALLLYATPLLSSFLRGINILPAPALFLFGLLGAEFLFALFLGAFSSFLAVLRYLK